MTGHLHCAELSREANAGLPYPPAFFDVITCTNVLHYLQEPVAVLRGFNTLLVKQGQLILEDYVLRGFPFPWKALEWLIRLYDPGHRFLFSQEQAQHLCQQAGFHVVRAQTFPIDGVTQGWTVCTISSQLLS
ncbi:MAG TPA: methyltransferase domain-containing protein [Ktedonobacteraceae bacterium]|nr:methyltransferase domain-containing protein [Ktedonobacteraceae bacterium]